MKRKLRILLLIAMFVALSCVIAFAETNSIVEFTDNTSGKISVQYYKGTDVIGTATPMNNTFGDINSSAVNVYPGAEKIKITYTAGTGKTDGDQYLVLCRNKSDEAVTADDIMYIDQNAISGSTISFTIYPKSLEVGKTYSIYLRTNGSDANLSSFTPVASFNYKTYTTPEYTLGDVKVDTAVNINDAMEIIYKIVGKTSFTTAQMLAADCTKDGIVNISDAMQIIYKIVGKIQSL